jgi:lysozyme
MEKLLDMLKRHEGVETHAYECSAGKITVGVGRNIDQAGGIGLR